MKKKTLIKVIPASVCIIAMTAGVSLAAGINLPFGLSFNIPEFSIFGNKINLNLNDIAKSAGLPPIVQDIFSLNGVKNMADASKTGYSLDATTAAHIQAILAAKTTTDGVQSDLQTTSEIVDSATNSESTREVVQRNAMLNGKILQGIGETKILQATANAQQAHGNQLREEANKQRKFEADFADSERKAFSDAASEITRKNLVIR
jgi:hypothetical protein